MNDIDLTSALMGKMISWPRKRGRYNASELYGITHGYITPKTWMTPKEKKPEDVLKMWNGIGGHNQIQGLLKKEYCEVKREYRYKDIVLVAKVDYLPEDPLPIWEIKTSADIMEKSSPSHEYQGRLYCTVFERPSTVILQPVQTKDKVFLRQIGIVTRDDDWFASEIEKLYKFHLKVEPLWPQN